MSIVPTAIPRASAGSAPASTPAPQAGEATVFISYSRRDMAFVDRLDAALQARGIKTLVDRAAIEVGERWLARLHDLITRAETIVFVLSAGSVASAVCAEEVAFGARLHKRFIPVVAERVADQDVPEALSELNYVFLDDPATFDSQVDRLATAIRTDLSWMRNHADLGRTAEEWAKAGRPRGLLLGATRLRTAEAWIAGRPANAPLPTDDTRDLIAASRRLARQWRNGLVGALAFGLVLALGLAAVAVAQRQEAVAQRHEAERQTALAVQRQGEAQEQRDAATRNFTIAKSTIDQVIFDLAQGLRDLEGIRVSVLRTVLSRVDAAVGRLVKAAPDDPAVQRSRHVMLNEFGATYLSAGDLPSAATAFAEALEITRGLIRRDPANLLWTRDLMVSLHRIGDLRMRTGDSTGALAAYAEALEVARDLAKRDPGGPDRPRDLSFSLNKIGDYKLRVGDLAGAQAAFEESVALRRDLVRRDPENPLLQRDLAFGIERLGDVRIRRGDVPGALAAREEVIRLRRALVDRDPDNTQWRRDLSIGFVRLGDLKLRAGDLAGALTSYQDGLDAQRALLRRDPDNALWQRDVVVSCNKIGDLRQMSGDRDAALPLYEEALGLSRALLKRDPSNALWRRDLSLGLERVGDVKAQSGDTAGALAAHQESLEIRRDLVRRDPNASEGWSDLVEGLRKVAALTPDRDRKRALLTEALEIADRLAKAGQLFADYAGWPNELRDELARL